MTNDSQFNVSVVIPTLNAGKYLPDLLPAIFAQEPLAPSEVILVDSMSTDDTRSIAAAESRVRVVPIRNFSHGRARNLGAREATSDIIVLLTQDATPANNRWLANLLSPMAEERVAAAYSRQVPRQGASPMERFFLQTRFPDTPPVVRVRSNGEMLTLEKVFFSNVSSAIRRKILMEHPFDESLIMSEDQQLSRDLLNAGYAVAYSSNSVVVHSHNYTIDTVFRRYFDSAYSISVILESHGVGTTISMGAPYMAREFCFMLRHHPARLPYYLVYNIAKSTGTLLGHLAPILPKWVLRQVSMHSYHWR